MRVYMILMKRLGGKQGPHPGGTKNFPWDINTHINTQLKQFTASGRPRPARPPNADLGTTQVKRLQGSPKEVPRWADIVAQTCFKPTGPCAGYAGYLQYAGWLRVALRGPDSQTL